MGATDLLEELANIARGYDLEVLLRTDGTPYRYFLHVYARDQSSFGIYKAYSNDLENLLSYAILSLTCKYDTGEANEL